MSTFIKRSSTCPCLGEKKKDKKAFFCFAYVMEKGWRGKETYIKVEGNSS